MLNKLKLYQNYNPRFFYFGTMLMASFFGVFYSKFAYYGDIPAHTIISKTLPFFDNEASRVFAYPIYHFCQKILHVICAVDYETVAALILSVSIIISVLLYRKLVLMIIDNTGWNKYWGDIIAWGGVLFGVVRSPLNHWFYYMLSGSPNPFHNPTILFVRPFGIASFIFYIKYVQTYKMQGYIKYIVLFSIMTFLSVGAKPSYAVVFLPAMGIYTLYYMIQNRKLYFGITALLAVFPSLVLLLIQQKMLSSTTKLLNISIKFGSYMNLNTTQVIVSSLIAFPVVVLLFQISLLKDAPIYFIGIIALVIGWCQMFLLKDSAGNFSWGYDLSIQFATIISLAESRKQKGKNKKIVQRLINYMAYLIFGYQIFSGIKYIHIMYTTTLFML